MEYLTALLSPQVLTVLGPVGVILAIVCWVLYSNYKKKDQLYIDLQNQRVKENQDMQKVYYDLAADVNKTLEILLSTLGRKSDPGNGNGGSKNV